MHSTRRAHRVRVHPMKRASPTTGMYTLSQSQMKRALFSLHVRETETTLVTVSCSKEREMRRDFFYGQCLASRTEYRRHGTLLLRLMVPTRPHTRPRNTLAATALAKARLQRLQQRRCATAFAVDAPRRQDRVHPRPPRPAPLRRVGSTPCNITHVQNTLESRVATLRAGRRQSCHAYAQGRTLA